MGIMHVFFFLTNLLAAKEALSNQLYPWGQCMIDIFNNTISCTIKHWASQGNKYYFLIKMQACIHIEISLHKIYAFLI